jgi:hypothetical protein
LATQNSRCGNVVVFFRNFKCGTTKSINNKTTIVSARMEVLQETSHYPSSFLRPCHIADLSPRPGFAPVSVHVGFVVEKWHWDIITLMVEAVSTSETSVYSNETIRRYIPEGCNLKTEVLLSNAPRYKPLWKFPIQTAR